MTMTLLRPKPDRRYDLDALRVLAFGLLILYHVGMFYVADWGWHIKSAYTAEWLKWPMRVVNAWRMPLLFLISGLAVHLLMQRAGPGAFAWMRTRRLLVPLLFGMAVVVPPQAYWQAVANGAFDGGYGAFLVHYLTFRPWPEGAFDGSHVGITWNHLWYLPYLLVYSLLLAAALAVLPARVPAASRARFERLRGARLWLLPVLPLALATWTLSARFPTTHDLLHDWHMHAQYFAMFVYGWLIGTAPGLWAELRARRHALLVGAIATFVAFAVLGHLTEPEPSVARALYDVAERLNTWTWILLVLAWGHHLLNRPFAWLPYANEAVYPWYVLHQSVTVMAGALLSRYALGPVVEPLLVVVVTVLGCGVLHEALIRRIPWLRPLFGLKPLRSHATTVPHLIEAS
jgi:glucans biosynthesis protein C